MLNQQGLLELVMKRRSIRNFKTDDVSDELINQVLEVARWAPSGANSQPWEFVVIKDKAARARIAEILLEALQNVRRMELTRDKEVQHPNANRDPKDFGFRDAPVFVILVGDPRARAAQVLAAQDSPQSYISGLSNAFLYMHLAAAALGLGSQYLSASSHPLSQALIKRELCIPQGFDIYDMFVLGYPAASPKPRKVRDMKSMVHYDRYDMSKHRNDAEVRNFCREMQLAR